MNKRKASKKRKILPVPYTRSWSFANEETKEIQEKVRLLRMSIDKEPSHNKLNLEKALKKNIDPDLTIENIEIKYIENDLLDSNFESEEFWELFIQSKETTSNKDDQNKSMTPKIWELLINRLPCQDQKGIVLDLEDMVDDLKTFGASKLEIFFTVLVHLLPLLPKFIFGELPITARRRRE